MMRVIFKNLEPSELAKDIVIERIDGVVKKFPDLSNGSIKLTLERHNSPQQAGPDLFSVSLHVAEGRYKKLRITKSNASLYVAVAELVDHLLEKLNRFGDKQRVRSRKILPNTRSI